MSHARLVPLKSKSITLILWNLGLGVIFFLMGLAIMYYIIEEFVAQLGGYDITTEKTLVVLIINGGFMGAMGIGIINILITQVAINRRTMYYITILVAIVNTMLWYMIAIIALKPNVTIGILNKIVILPKVLAIYAVQQFENPSVLWLYCQCTYNALLLPLFWKYGLYVEEKK